MAADVRATGPGQPDLQAVAAVLGENGLVPRGGFSFEAGEVAPAGPAGTPARAALIVGQAGASIWPYLSRWRAA